MHFAFDCVAQFGDGLGEFIEFFFHSQDEVAGHDDGKAGVGDEGQDFVEGHGGASLFVYGKEGVGCDGDELGFLGGDEFAFGAEDAGSDDGLGAGFGGVAVEAFFWRVDAKGGLLLAFIDEGEIQVFLVHGLPPYTKVSVVMISTASAGFWVKVLKASAAFLTAVLSASGKRPE